MLKLCAAAALALSVSAFLLESHSLIWLVAGVLPGAFAVLRGGRKVDAVKSSASLTGRAGSADAARARPTTVAARERCPG